jgi:predicted metal-dependent hydrolase
VTAPLTGAARASFEAGVRSFDAGDFFAAHERFEDVWRSPSTHAADRAFWKGVTQTAVALHHAQRGNAKGAATLARRALTNLARYPSPHQGVETRVLLDANRALADAIEAGSLPAPPLRVFPLAR